MCDHEKSITLQQLLDEIKTNRIEIKNKIDATETKLLMIVESVNERVKVLEKENATLKQEIEHLKRDSKKNNLVFFGLNIPQNTFTVDTICQKIETLLEIQVEPKEINNFYKFGKTGRSAIKVELTSFRKKLEILKNCYKLKGTNITLVPDQTPQQQEESKVLKRHFHIAKQDKNNTCYIKNNKLYINGNSYSAKDLVAAEEEEAEKIDKTNSAPSTPTIVFQTTNLTSKVNTITNITPTKSDINNRKPITRQNSQQDPKKRNRSNK